MASNNQIKNPSYGVPSRSKFLLRVPYFYQSKHNNDKFINLGYDYHGKILRKVTSSELWSNPIQIPIIGQIETLLTFIIEETKMVKKWMSIAHERDTLRIN